MILVVGSGYIGSHLVETLPGAVSTGLRLHEIRLTRGITAVINAAGRTDLAWCEAHQKEAHQTNVTDAVDLAIRAAALEIPFIQLSSGCIWDGPYRADGQPFEPDDTPQPASYYAETKAKADRFILHLSRRAKVTCLRLRMPFDGRQSPRNLLDKLSRYPALIDEPQSITSVWLLRETVEALIDDLSLSLWNRAVNVYQTGTVSPYEIGCMLADAGVRGRPEQLSKPGLDSWHRPKRVSTVLRDAEFERVIRPDDVRSALGIAITAFAGKPNA